ncbi:MAG: hypothetical protein HZC41_25455 [Chloroflexi bacterium]|nr:hypothetical protein [Chloroflexota bacterium]
MGNPNDMNPMLSTGAGYFHWPPIWVGQIPSLHDTSAWSIEVFRTSLPQGITLIVEAQGVFIFDFSTPSRGYVDPQLDWVASTPTIQQAIYFRISVLNAHLVCLYAALAQEETRHLRKMVVTPSNMLSYRSIDEKGVMHHESVVNAQYHFVRSSDAIPPEFQWWREKRSAVISIQVLENSCQLMDQILRHPSSDALDLVNLYLRSCKAYEDHDFGLCLATSWTVTEKLLGVFWQGYLDHLDSARMLASGKQKSNKELHKILIEGRAYSASAITKKLRLAGVIPASLCEELNSVRQFRNKWVHGLVAIDSDKGQEALRLAGEMLRLIYELDLRVPFTLEMLF